MMPLMWPGYLIFAPFFVWIHAKGIEAGKSAVRQGVRFGLAFGVGLSAMSSLIWYIVLPIPASLAWAWFAAGVIVYLAPGVAAALTYAPDGPISREGLVLSPTATNRLSAFPRRRRAHLL